MATLSDKTELFARMPVRRAVIKQIVPAIASQMIMLVYNLADTYFVGMLNDPGQTAAITVVGSTAILLTAISNLFGIGAASMIAASLGRNEPHKARQTAGIAFWCGIGSALIFSVLFAFLAKPILMLCGATADTYIHTWNYARWLLVWGGPFTILSTLLANMIRAEGNASAASFGISFGCVLNIILDPFFVLPQFLGGGAGGAGLATAISNAVSALFFLGYLAFHRRDTVLSLSPRHLRHIRDSIRPVLSVGFPSAIQYVLTTVANSALMKTVSGYPTEALAAVGIVKKLDQVPLFFSIGVASGLLPLLAFNHAAGNHERRSQAFRFGIVISVSFSFLCLICYELFAPTLTGFFMDDPVTVAYAADFLRIAVIAMPMVAVCYPMIIQFQAMRQVKEALVASLIRKGLLDFPLLFIMNALWPLYGCLCVQPIVDLTALVVVIIFYRRIQKKQRVSAQI